MSLATILPVITPIVMFIISRFISDKERAAKLQLSWEQWVMREQNRAAIAASQKQNVRDQHAELERRRKEREKKPPGV